MLVVQLLLLANKVVDTWRAPSAPSCPSLEILPAICPDVPPSVSECPAVVREELALLRQERAAEAARTREPEELGVDPKVFAAAVAGWVFNGFLALAACCRRNAPVRREWRRDRGAGVLD